MARYAAPIPTWTPTAFADATAITDGAHHSIQSGGAVQRGEIREVYIGGQAGASAPTFWVLGRLTTSTSTLVATRLAALDAFSALSTTLPTAYQSAGTSKPSRHTTSGMLLQLSMNAFGGIVRWYAGPDEVLSYAGNSAPNSELSLNAFTGGTPGLCATNIIFEVV